MSSPIYRVYIIDNQPNSKSSLGNFLKVLEIMATNLAVNHENLRRTEIFCNPDQPMQWPTSELLYAPCKLTELNRTAISLHLLQLSGSRL